MMNYIDKEQREPFNHYNKEVYMEDQALMDQAHMVVQVLTDMEDLIDLDQVLMDMVVQVFKAILIQELMLNQN